MNTTALEDLHFTWESSMKENDEDTENIHRVLLDYYTNDDGTVDIDDSPGQFILQPASLVGFVKKWRNFKQR